MVATTKNFKSSCQKTVALGIEFLKKIPWSCHWAKTVTHAVTRLKYEISDLFKPYDSFYYFLFRVAYLHWDIWKVLLQI